MNLARWLNLSRTTCASRFYGKAGSQSGASISPDWFKYNTLKNKVKVPVCQREATEKDNKLNGKNSVWNKLRFDTIQQ